MVLKLAAALLDDWVSCRLRHASGSTPAVGGETALEDSPTPTPPWSTARVAAQRAPAASAVLGHSLARVAASPLVRRESMAEAGGLSYDGVADP